LDVADEDVIRAADAVGPTLERKTARQQNSHPPRSLAWLSWIAARLGGRLCHCKRETTFMNPVGLKADFRLEGQGE